MSTPSPFSRRPVGLPSVPKGESLGPYETYPEAQKIVDRLAKADFDVKQLAIIGNDLKTVERVTGKLTYGRAAAAGAASGAWFGLFAGVLLTLFSATPNYALVGAAIFIGAGFGILFSLATYAVNRRRRDFTSTHQVLASSYEIILPSELLVRAQELLERPEE